MSRLVLVVDDDPLVLEVTALMLEDIGCEALTATCGEDALERLSRDSRIEVLITDVNMPGMDGRALAAAAVRDYPRLKVLLLSGRARDGDGFPLIRKPFLEQDLERAMQQHTGTC
jgi:CheY-like chemotaxis protein